MDECLNKRILKIFCFMMFLFIFIIFNLEKISTNESLYESAANQFFYKLKVANLRGMIYDRNNLPLIETEEKIMAVVSPYSKNIMNLLNYSDENGRKKIDLKLKNNEPFVIELKEVPKLIDDSTIFKVSNHSKENILAIHNIGYVDGQNSGVVGIERAYNDFLKDGAIEVDFLNTANRKLIGGGRHHVIDKTFSSNKGIKLTLDKRMQIKVEEIASKHFKKGAVIVAKVPNCQIISCVSLPKFVPKNADLYLTEEDKPFINRCASSYNVGSIFKLLTAAIMIENGFSRELCYDCKGYYTLECGRKLHCFRGKKHNKIDLKDAISCSCNGYFASVSKKINPSIFIDYANRLGFGKCTKLAHDFVSESGNLPTLDQLSNEKNLAVFSFGQGYLLATPFQIAAFINAIASDGYYVPPSLVIGLIDSDMNIKLDSNFKQDKPKRQLKTSTCKALKEFMLESINNGTSSKGKSKYSAGAKTSTAETGIFKNSSRVTQSWFAGFLPFENPKYTVTILVEEQTGETNPCAPVFKEINEYINENIHLFL